MVFRNLAWAAAVCGTAAAAFPAQGAETFQADAVHSSIVFRVKHLNTAYIWGRFNDFSGSFTLDAADPAQSKFDFQVKTASVDTANAQRDRHVKSPDFLNAVQYPTISFKSRAAASAGSDAFEVTGDLTLHGITRPVTVKIVKTGAGKNRGRSIAGISADFSVKQSEFGMSKNAAALGDEVWINVGIEGTQR